VFEKRSISSNDLNQLPQLQLAGRIVCHVRLARVVACAAVTARGSNYWRVGVAAVSNLPRYKLK
jgi:hypothetical protein